MFNNALSHHKFYYSYPISDEIDFELGQVVKDVKSKPLEQMNYINKQKESVSGMSLVQQIPNTQNFVLSLISQVEKDTNYGGLILEQFLKLTVNSINSIEWVFQDVYINQDQPLNFINEYKGVYSWVLWYGKSNNKHLHIFPSFSDQGIFPFYSNDKENLIFSGSVAVALK